MRASAAAALLALVIGGCSLSDLTACGDGMRTTDAGANDAPGFDTGRRTCSVAGPTEGCPCHTPGWIYCGPPSYIGYGCFHGLWSMGICGTPDAGTTDAGTDAGGELDAAAADDPSDPDAG